MGKYIAYPAYKDSGVEWLGDVPEHWTVERLNDIASIKQSNVDKKSLANQDEVRLCNYVDVYYNSKITANLNFMKATASEEEIKKFQLQKDDVIITKDSESPDDIGIAALVIENVENLLCGYHLAIIRDANKLINGGFLYYALSSRPSCHQFLLAAKGVTRFGLSHSNIKNIQLSLPKIHEQQQIADFLDEKTAHLDKLIGQKQQMIGLLNEKRMALITQAVTKGLDLTVPMKDSGVEWLGDVPKHWIVAGLTKFIESQVDYRGKTPEKVKSGTFLVTARNIKEGQINYDLSSEFVREEDYLEIMRRGIPEIGDVLFTTEAPLGEIANIDRTDIALAQRIIKIRGNSGVLNNYFLKYWMMSLMFQQHLWSLATGSTALGIKASKIFELRCVIPPFQEQTDNADYIDTETQKIDDMITTVKQAIATLQEYRTALITAAVTGKIDVRGFKLPKQTTLDDLAGCTRYHGAAKTLEDMDATIEQGIIAKWGRHDSNL